MAHIYLKSVSGYVQNISARMHEFRSDEPEDNGGTDTAPAPYELLLGSLAACTSLTLRMYADRKKWDLGTIEIHAGFARDDNGDESITREVVIGNDLSAEQIQRLAEICEKTPVTKTLKRGTPVETRITASAAGQEP